MTSVGKNTRSPRRKSPAKNNRSPRRKSPAKNNRSPRRKSPAKKNRSPRRKSPAKNNKSPRRKSPAKNNKSPRRKSPAKNIRSTRRKSPKKMRGGVVFGDFEDIPLQLETNTLPPPPVPPPPVPVIFNFETPVPRTSAESDLQQDAYIRRLAYINANITKPNKHAELLIDFLDLTKLVIATYSFDILFKIKDGTRNLQKAYEIHCTSFRPANNPNIPQDTMYGHVTLKKYTNAREKIVYHYGIYLISHNDDEDLLGNPHENLDTLKSGIKEFWWFDTGNGVRHFHPPPFIDLTTHNESKILFPKHNNAVKLMKDYFNWCIHTCPTPFKEVTFWGYNLREMVDKRIDVLEKKIRYIYTQLEVLDAGISFGDFDPGERETLITHKNNLEEELQLISMNRFDIY